MTRRVRSIVARGIGVLKWTIGLIALVVLGIGVYRLYAPAQWRCVLDTGGFIYVDGEPSGEWLQDRDSTTLYPRDRIEECVELTE